MGQKSSSNTFATKYFTVLTSFKNLARKVQHQPSVVAWTCNPATLEAEFWNSVGLISVGCNSPSVFGWIV